MGTRITVSHLKKVSGTKKNLKINPGAIPCPISDQHSVHYGETHIIRRFADQKDLEQFRIRIKTKSGSYLQNDCIIQV